MLVFQLQSQEEVKGQENKKSISFQINIFCVMFKKNKCHSFTLFINNTNNETKK